MFPSYQTLSTDTARPHLAMITLNRLKAANALNTQMARELENIFQTIAKAPDIRVVILTGAGKHFCAGADLKERQGIDEKTWQQQHDLFEKALHTITHCPIPVIAAVHGTAMGGGLEIALACDFIYASTNARFALTEATLGIMPGLGGTQRLPRAIGIAQAKERIFTGKPFTAEEALRLGMVNAVFAPEKLLDETITIAKVIAQNAPLSLRAIKSAIDEGAALPIEDALHCELKYYNPLLKSKDRQEGIAAFNEKRKPAFSGA